MREAVSKRGAGVSRPRLLDGMFAEDVINLKTAVAHGEFRFNRYILL